MAYGEEYVRVSPLYLYSISHSQKVLFPFAIAGLSRIKNKKWCSIPDWTVLPCERLGDVDDNNSSFWKVLFQVGRGTLGKVIAWRYRKGTRLTALYKWTCENISSHSNLARKCIKLNDNNSFAITHYHIINSYKLYFNSLNKSFAVA